MNRYTIVLFLTFCVYCSMLTVSSTECFALDPMFELDTKALGRKTRAVPKNDVSVPKTQATGVPVREPQADPLKSLKAKHGSRSERLRKAASRKNNSRRTTSGQRLKSRKKFPAVSVASERDGLKRENVPPSVSSGKLVHSLRMSAGGAGGIKWAKEVWDRIIPSVRQENGPLVVQGRNFSLSLDPKRYPVLPAADGGKIVIDEARTLPPLVKTILREKDPGIRIVEGSPADRKSFFSSLLAAARFYSVEDNFSMDFGSNPKLTVTSDFKIEKTSESLLKSDVILVNLDGKRKGMPPPLVAFLAKEGFHVVESSPAFSEMPDGHNLLYSIDGSNQDTIVDELYSALSVRYEKNKDLLLDNGSLSGVTLTVRADRYSENAKRKVVVSFSEENPVQYTLLRLLELKGYRVVMLKTEDDFREISEKILTSLGLPAHYGMQPLWVPDETPFNVQLSGFVVAGSGRNGVRRFLTNVPIDPLVGELARYKGFDVIVK